MILVEEIFPQTMKEMQEMAQESDAIQNCDFDTARFVILGAGLITNVVGHGFGCDEDVILNVFPLAGDFLKRAVNITTLHRFAFHFIARHHFVLAEQRDLNVPHSAILIMADGDAG